MEQSLRKKLVQAILLPLVVVTLMWLFFVGEQLLIDFDILGRHGLHNLGIFPRKWYGLIGIFTTPLIHSDLKHLYNNSVPIFIAGASISLLYPKVAKRTFVLCYILTGIGVWIAARPSWHIGASGVVYGLIAFLFFSGVFRRTRTSIVIALIVVLYYSGMIAGLFPNDNGVSWESHLIGGVVGALAAFAFRRELEAGELEERPYYQEVVMPKRHFLPRDTFEKTLKQRKAEAEAAQNRPDFPFDWVSDYT